MRLKKTCDSGILSTMAVTYRVTAQLKRDFGISQLKSSALLLLGSYSNESRSEDVPMLSVPEIQTALSYSKSNSMAVYYAVHEMCEGKEPLLKREQKGRISYFLLTAQG